MGLFVISAQIFLLCMQMWYTKDISLIQPDNEEHRRYSLHCWEGIKIPPECSMSWILPSSNAILDCNGTVSLNVERVTYWQG